MKWKHIECVQCGAVFIPTKRTRPSREARKAGWQEVRVGLDNYWHCPKDKRQGVAA